MMPHQPVAQQDQTTFRQVCRVRCAIRATPAAIWSLLTDARGFTTWNTTVTSLEGEIALGSKLALRVKLDPKRTFRPKVTKLEPAKTMEWNPQESARLRAGLRDLRFGLETRRRRAVGASRQRWRRAVTARYLSARGP
jgi:uncharacterized protein YndB with AHSA1/START domain